MKCPSHPEPWDWWFACRAWFNAPSTWPRPCHHPHSTGDNGEGPTKQNNRAQRHTALEWQGQDLNQNLPVSKSGPFDTLCLPFQVPWLMRILTLLANDDQRQRAHVWMGMVSEEDRASSPGHRPEADPFHVLESSPRSLCSCHSDMVEEVGRGRPPAVFSPPVLSPPGTPTPPLANPELRESKD